MEKSTHSERVAVALAMRAACVAACNERAPAREADGYKASEDKWSDAAKVVHRVDVSEVVLAAGNAPPPGSKEAFEIAATQQFFNCQKRDNGDYFHPITIRAWKLWQMAIKFQQENNNGID